MFQLPLQGETTFKKKNTAQRSEERPIHFHLHGMVKPVSISELNEFFKKEH